MSPSLTLFCILRYRWNICFDDGVRIESSHSMNLESLRDLSKDTILATSKVAIYFFTYVDCATVYTYATSQTNHAFSSNNRLLLNETFLVVWDLHHRNSLRQVDFHSHHMTRKHIFSSHETLKYILNIYSLIHPRIALEPVLQPRTCVTLGRAFNRDNVIEPMTKA